MSEASHFAFGDRILEQRYSFFPGETRSQQNLRVAKHVANGNAAHQQMYQDILDARLFSPGGRIRRGCGYAKGSLHNCLAGETLVHTDKGVFPAFMLAGSTHNVLTKEGKYRPAFWKSYGRQELYEVFFENGETLFATAEHEWVVSKPQGYEKVKTTELKGRRIPQQADPVKPVNEEEFREGIRHGLTFGDGCLYMKHKHACIKQFGDSKHLVYDYFSNVREEPSSGATVATLLPVHYKKMITGGESYSYIRGFIAGIIAADGCVSINNGNVMIHQADRVVLENLACIAASVGIPVIGIKTTRTHNPWTGEYSPVFQLRFVRKGVDRSLILKEKHRAYFDAHPPTLKRHTMKVAHVTKTNRVEEVYCCVEPVTHTFVIGNGYVTGNCFTLDVEDSREGWGKLISNVIVISGVGGGVGINFSSIRQRGASIKGTGGEATGAVSLMRLVNSVGNEIKEGGGRRCAFMFCLNHDHPDILEFIDSKLDHGQLNNANISVVFMNESMQEFFAKVDADEGHDLVFGGKVVRTIQARELWRKLLENSLRNGEPGILNGFLANEQNPISYCRELTSTNPCGEVWMQPYSVCDLGSLVLPRFVRNGKFELDKFEYAVGVSVRFLDSCLDVTKYPLAAIEEESKKTRRIGLGIMGFTDMLAELGVKYSDQRAVEWAAHLGYLLQRAAYKASANLARELGHFPLYNKRKHLAYLAPFLNSDSFMEVAQYGLRNCALTSIAPTGTTSIVEGVWGAFEPYESPVYWRTFRNSDASLGRELVVMPTFERFVKEGRDLSVFEHGSEISIDQHLAVQYAFQQHTDNSVSKTINVDPGQYTSEEFDSFVRKHAVKLKGFTVYPRGSRENSPIQEISMEEGKRLVLENAESTNDAVCVGGQCEVTQ